MIYITVTVLCFLLIGAGQLIEEKPLDKGMYQFVAMVLIAVINVVVWLRESL